MEIAPNQIWQHRNGIQYRVLMITNLPDDERYPKTVVYENVDNGSCWSRRHDNWHRSMTYIGTWDVA